MCIEVGDMINKQLALVLAQRLFRLTVIFKGLTTAYPRYSGIHTRAIYEAKGLYKHVDQDQEKT